MRSRLLLAALTAALTLAGGVGVAHAQDTPPADCAAANTALIQADAAHRDAVEADKAAADADGADDELERAEDRLQDAQDDLRIARDELTQKQARVDELNAAGSTATEQQKKDAKAARDAAQDDVDDAQDKVDDLKDARDDAEKAADSDELELRDKAAETDADALATALDKARADYNRVCGQGAPPTAPTTTPSTPAPTATPTQDIDCDDVSREEAQDILDADLSDPNNLDMDANAIACDNDEKKGFSQVGGGDVPRGSVPTGA